MDRSRYPPDWAARSRHYRFEVAAGVCEKCGVRHGHVVAKGPDLTSEYPATRIAIWLLNTAHRDRDPTNNEPGNYVALCPRCHALYDMDDIQTKLAYGYDHAGSHQLRLSFDENSPVSGEAGL